MAAAGEWLAVQEATSTAKAKVGRQNQWLKIKDQQGNVTNTRILKALPMGLDKAAEDAVKKRRYKPAMLNGRPVKVYMVVTVNFQLQ